MTDEVRAMIFVFARIANRADARDLLSEQAFN
jgi:hypothetical protein